MGSSSLTSAWMDALLASVVLTLFPWPATMASSPLSLRGKQLTTTTTNVVDVESATTTRDSASASRASPARHAPSRPLLFKSNKSHSRPFRNHQVPCNKADGPLVRLADGQCAK